MDVPGHYRSLLQHSEQVLNGMLADGDALEALTRSHNHLLEYDLLKSAIVQRPEVDALNVAVKEYQFALFALSMGLYRHAFSGLRLFFELMLSTIQFSAHEIDYRMWSNDRKDINWNALRNGDTGVFSVNFINAFNPAFAEHAKQYAAIAETVYRECSEFVHGNASTHGTLPSDIAFDKSVFLSWHKKAEAMRVAVVFAYAARYLGYLDADARRAIEPAIMETIGHLPVVQAMFAAPPED